MSDTETDGEAAPTDFVDSVRHKIDDAIDVVETFVAEKVAKLPSLLQAPMKLAADGAFATIRGILGVPDNYGGDAD